METKCCLKKINPPEVAVYHDKLGFLGWINEYEFNDLRIQIKNHKEEGWYIRLRLNDTGNLRTIGMERHYINSDGTMIYWPDDLFPLMEKQLEELTKWH